MFVVRRSTDKKFLAIKGEKHFFIKDLLKAAIFKSYFQASNIAVKGSNWWYITPVSELLEKNMIKNL